jgi:Sortase domain
LQETWTGHGSTALVSAPVAGPGLAGPALTEHDCRRPASYLSRLGPGWGALAGALAVLGAVLVVIAVLAQESPPGPPRDLGTIPAAGRLMPARTSPGQPGWGLASAAWISAVRERPGLPPPPAAAGAGPSTAALPRSRPVSLAIPAIGVHTHLVDLGLGPHHTLQVPPLTQAGVQEAGWYDLGPAPGQLGPAVIAGHVDSYQGPGIFFRLGALRPGDRIRVTRADASVAIFRTDAVDEYRKASFPDRQVYGPVSYAGLRLITCGGRFDYQTHHYLSNIVIYATLTGSRPERNR